MKLTNKWMDITSIPATQDDPTSIIGIYDGKLYITYDVDTEPAENWVWTAVSGKVEEDL